MSVVPFKPRGMSHQPAHIEQANRRVRVAMKLADLLDHRVSTVASEYCTEIHFVKPMYAEEMVVLMRDLDDLRPNKRKRRAKA